MAGLNLAMTKGIGTTGHVGTATLDVENAWGDSSSTVVGENLRRQDES
jgi:putative transposase